MRTGKDIKKLLVSPDYFQIYSISTMRNYMWSKYAQKTYYPDFYLQRPLDRDLVNMFFGNILFIMGA